MKKLALRDLQGKVVGKVGAYKVEFEIDGTKDRIIIPKKYLKKDKMIFVTPYYSKITKIIKNKEYPTATKFSREQLEMCVTRTMGYKYDCDLKHVAEIIKTTFDCITKAVSNDNSVIIPNFGVFELKKRTVKMQNGLIVFNSKKMGLRTRVLTSGTLMTPEEYNDMFKLNK